MRMAERVEVGHAFGDVEGHGGGAQAGRGGTDLGGGSQVLVHLGRVWGLGVR